MSKLADLATAFDTAMADETVKQKAFDSAKVTLDLAQSDLNVTVDAVQVANNNLQAELNKFVANLPPVTQINTLVR
jgi:hypothetical protein